MTAQIQITVDGMSRVVASDSKPTLMFEEMYPDRVKPGPNAIVVCKINGALRDLWTDLNDGDVVESLRRFKKPFHKRGSELALLSKMASIMTLTLNDHLIQRISPSWNR
jgi:hypothetical protein